ncbi:MAG: hypothetical protein ABSB01_18805 [Streptosporangiaceae bacterium]|jgi:hypothetical protein
MSRIRVTIDQLVLNGFEASERQAFIDGLRAELTLALADPRSGTEWARPYRTNVLRLGGIPAERGAAGRRSFGRRLGRAIERSLKR